MSEETSLREAIMRRFTRRTMLRASGSGVATAVIVGLGERPAAAAPAPVAAVAPAPTNLEALDPHAYTGRRWGQADTGMDQTQTTIRILPINRAKLLAGGRFDLRVEAHGVDPDTARITLNVAGDNGPVPLLRGEPVRTSATATSLEITYPGLAYDGPGSYTVSASVDSGGQAAQAAASHEVVVPATAGKKAKNVIFFLGDGMGIAPITAARILSRGITEGRYNGLLELDQMQYRGFVTTSGVDSISTDSANSMSAYMTGHKSSVNALGVYESDEPDPNRHPRVETMAELLKRTRGMGVGVVTTAEVQDATPAAVWAHTRRRSEYPTIMDQALDRAQQPDVLMGGGSATLLPQSQPGSRRKDDRDLVQEFQSAGFSWAASRGQLNDVMAAGAPSKLLALFHYGHMNFYMDREFLKNPLAPNPSQSIVAPQFDDQPTLMEMTTAALKVLEKNPNGFFLMVEGASIDKAEHPLDWQRAAYDTIEFDHAVGVAKRWAANRDDTLIVVTADHNHAMSIAGTNDLNKGVGRQGNGVYAEAGFPGFVPNPDGFPSNPDPDKTLYIAWSNHPDFRDAFRFEQGGYVEPALVDNSDPNAPKPAVPNPKRDDQAELQTGNLNFGETNSVHTVEDVGIWASGPGAERFNALLDNTEVFFSVMDALGLDARKSIA